MKNKGFTLVEVIAVIAILGTIMILGTSSYLSYYDSLKEKNKENSLEIVYESAIEYYNNTYKTTFLISDLLDNGYLKANKNNTMMINDEDYRCYAININNTNEIINNKNYTKVEAVLGENYYDESTKECNLTNYNSEKFSLAFSNNTNNKIVIELIFPANTSVTLINNLGYYAHYNSTTEESNKKSIDYESDYKGPIIFTATFVEKLSDTKTSTITKTIKIDNKGD